MDRVVCPHLHMAEIKEEQLKQLIGKLESAFQDRLVSVILYGSGASDGHHNGFSDLNVLCVLKHVTPRELGDGEPIVRWWRGHGHPSPLMMSEEEAHNSADSFPSNFAICRSAAKFSTASTSSPI